MERALAAERTARHTPNHKPRSLLEWTAVTLILLSVAFLRFHDLGNIPKGLEHDEIATWSMVQAVLEGDRPIYFEEGYGHEPLFNYLTAVPMAFFGDSVTDVCNRARLDFIRRGIIDPKTAVNIPA